MIPIENLRVVSAFASFLTLMKLFDWLRLFEGTGKYILLVIVTLKDTKSFVLLILITLMMFGVPLVMLNANGAEDKELTEKVFDNWIFDLMYTQYMLALGMFEHENFDDHPQAMLAYIFFLMATFLSQVTMLNMLIAIMGDSFDKVIENRDVNSIRMKLEILSELSAVLPSQSSE